MIKNNFAVLMAERGLKIADVYEATGISKTTLMAIADNTGKGVQYDTIDKLCIHLGVEPKDFFIYIPYNWHFYFPNNEELNDFFILDIKGNNYQKSFYFWKILKLSSSNNFPMVHHDYDYWFKIILEPSETYDKDELNSLFKNCHIIIKSILKTEIKETLTEYIHSLIGTKQSIYDIEERNKFDVTLNKGDNIYVEVIDGFSRGELYFNFSLTLD